jgi:hypothetical protein
MQSQPAPVVATGAGDVSHVLVVALLDSKERAISINFRGARFAGLSATQMWEVCSVTRKIPLDWSV